MNEFGHLVLKHCERHGLTLKELARAAKLKAPSRIYYAIRSREDPRRKTPLREDELDALADVLKLSVEGREEFVITAQLAVASDRLRRYVRRLEALRPPNLPQ